MTIYATLRGVTYTREIVCNGSGPSSFNITGVHSNVESLILAKASPCMHTSGTNANNISTSEILESNCLV